MILPDTTESHAYQRAEELRSVLDRAAFAVPHLNLHLSVTVSIGISLSEGEGDTAARMIKRADDQLLKAKIEGRNKVSMIRHSAA